MMEFNISDFNNAFMLVITNGFSTGLVLGFITWSLGYAVTATIKFFKLSTDIR